MSDPHGLMMLPPPPPPLCLLMLIRMLILMLVSVMMMRGSCARHREWEPFQDDDEEPATYQTLLFTRIILRLRLCVREGVRASAAALLGPNEPLHFQDVVVGSYF